jgi:hypothetical protein
MALSARLGAVAFSDFADEIALDLEAVTRIIFLVDAINKFLELFRIFSCHVSYTFPFLESKLNDLLFYHIVKRRASGRVD